MTGTTHSVIAAFRTKAEAEAAASDLKAAGLSSSDIHVESGSGTTTGSTGHGTHEAGIAGWFKSVFGDESNDDRAGYENALQQGRAILRVDADDTTFSTVEAVLNRHNPIDIHEGSSASQTAGASAAGTTRSQATGRGRGTEAGQAIPVVQEQLQIGKRQILKGGVRVYSRVIEQPVEEKVSLREERVRVDRQPANRAATDADLTAGREKVIEVQEFAEQPVVSKQARVVEEVRVGKDVTERTENVRDTVRRTEVNVERTGGSQPTNGGTAGTYGRTQTYDDADFRSDFQSRYGASGASYSDYEPAYQYGYDMASNERYRGRSWDEVESDLRSDYGRRYPQSTWEKMKDSVRYGWDKVTGKTRAAVNR